MSAYLTLKQTEKELNPNLSEMLCCSWFLLLLLYGFLHFLFCYFVALLIILFSIAFCHHFFLVALFLCPWFMTDTCLTSLSFQKEFIHPWKGHVTPGSDISLCHAGLFVGMLNNNSYKLQELIFIIVKTNKKNCKDGIRKTGYCCLISFNVHKFIKIP